MPTGVRIPVSLGRPDRAAYGDSFEDIREVTPMEIGTSRFRKTMRVPARLFTLQWTWTQEQFTIFDLWWQDDIQGGALPFDIQLLDDDQTLTWFTVYAVGVYNSEVIEDSKVDWRVRLDVRAREGTFGTVRPAGTDELEGRGRFGIRAADGAIQISKTSFGRAEFGMAGARARFAVADLHGAGTFGITGASATLPGTFYGTGSFGITQMIGVLAEPEPAGPAELARQWIGLGWMRPQSTLDINTEPTAVNREWMEI